MLIKSVVNENRNNYYYNIFFKNGSYKDKSNAQYFDRISISEGIDVNKTSASKECDICHYWCFLNESFKFQQI